MKKNVLCENYIMSWLSKVIIDVKYKVGWMVVKYCYFLLSLLHQLVNLFVFLQIEFEVKFIHSQSQELKGILTQSQQNVLVSFTRSFMFRIEVIVPEKYLLKGFLEVAYNAAIVLKKLRAAPQN